MYALSAHLRANVKLVICAASTGIAALHLPGGPIAHSSLKIAFVNSLTEGSTCNIKAESECAQALRRTDLLIWDEIPMSHRLAQKLLISLMDMRQCNNLSVALQRSFLVTGAKWILLYISLQHPTSLKRLSFRLICGNMLNASASSSPCVPPRQTLVTVRSIGESKIAPIILPDLDIALRHITVQDHKCAPSTCTVKGVTHFGRLVAFVYPDLRTADPSLLADRGI